ncbi:MAG: glycosyltransferase [Rectinemataceae bacterium]|jgi:glycosyltransferase involved in cell wall biosynthesis
MTISLCLLVWNELEGCKRDIPNVPRSEFDEIYAIDGGSSDGTVEYLESQGITVHQQSKKGLNAAYIDAAAVSSCDAVAVFFPKGTIPVSDLAKFRLYLESGSELVIASRQVRGSVNEEDSSFFRPRKWAVRCLALLAALLWRREGYWVRDTLHGVKAFTRSAFSRMRILDHGLSIDIEMVARAYKLRIPRCEFPTIESARSSGASHFKIGKTGMLLLKYLWFELRRKESPDKVGEEA